MRSSASWNGNRKRSKISSSSCGIWSRRSLLTPPKKSYGAVKGGICQIEIHIDHVRLSFIHGAFLPDPQELLQGERLYKRYVRLASYESVPWEALRELIHASAQFDPASLK